MATFTFDGSESITTPFNVATDRVIFNLNAADFVSITEDRSNNTVSFVTTSGAVLTLTNTNFAAISAAQPNSLVPGIDSDIRFDIGTRSADSGAEPNGTLLGNVVVGLEGEDVLTGARNAGEDAGSPGGVLLGNQGDDIISNGPLFSVNLFGGQGNDRIALATANGSDESLIVGGLGADTISVGATISGAGTTAQATAGGYQGDVTIFGGNEAGDPADGADQITVALGQGGSALIFANGGNDTVSVSGGGADSFGVATVFGGAGNDTISATVEGGQFVGGLGTDSITVVSDSNGTVVGGNDFTVVGGNGVADAADSADTITLTLQANDTALVFGNGGNDSISLLGEVDSEVQVFGGQGNDTITGFVGDDSLLVGGLGSDLINVTVVNQGTGDTAIGSHITVTGGNGVADAADGADRISVALSGDARGANPVQAQSADIFGNGGDDMIVLTGEGSASVHGGQGSDTIVSGDGLYVLTGGQGADRFDFSATTGTAGVNGEFVAAVPATPATPDAPATPGTPASGVLDANTVAADIVRITDLNFDEDEINLTNTISVTANLSGTEQFGTNLAEAAARALSSATQTTSGELDAAVIFSYQGQQYLVAGDASGPNVAFDIANVDALINITGFTGTIDNSDFV